MYFIHFLSFILMLIAMMIISVSFIILLVFMMKVMNIWELLAFLIGLDFLYGFRLIVFIVSCYFEFMYIFI